MATLKNAEDSEYKIKQVKVEYAFYLVAIPYDWYLANHVINLIEVDSPMKEVLTKLKTVLKQAGY